MSKEIWDELETKVTGREHIEKAIARGRALERVAEAAIEMKHWASIEGHARAYGIAKIAKTSSLNRESLYKALSETGNPAFATIRSILDVLGIRIELKLKTG